MRSTVHLLALCVLVVGANAQYDYVDVLDKSILFYEAQRSGALPADNRVLWREDSAMGDLGNAGEDLTGGWYDAGDHIKVGLPMAYAVTTLAWGIDTFRTAYESAGLIDEALDSIKWPLDYFIKCHLSANVIYGQVADGNADHSYWGRPEDMTMPRPAWELNTTHPGSDLAGETAAAMAAASIVFQSTDAAYASTLLSHAREIYDFAYTYRAIYTDSIPNAIGFYASSGYNDELTWGGLWLYKATGEQLYMTRALETYNAGTPPAFSWDDKNAGNQVLMYEATSDNRYADHVRNFLNSWFPGGSVPYTPLGLAWIDQWGTLRYSANTALVALVAAEQGILVSESQTFARNQIHYMLGDTGRSYVVGFGTNPPRQPHHRAASCPWPPTVCGWQDHDKVEDNPHILYGALVGGPDQNDQYVDDRADYISNEVTTDYNSCFQGAVAGLLSLP